MKRKNVLSRLTTLVLATFACLLLALLAPVFFAYRSSDEPFSVSRVMASPRDMHVITTPIQLSITPDLVLSRGALYADGNASAGLPSSRFVLDGPVFTLNASGFKATGVGFEGGALDAAFAPLVEQLANMGFDTLAIRRGTLNITTIDGTSETFSDIDAEVTGRRKGVISAKGQFKVRGQKLHFDGSLAQIADKATPMRWPARFTVKGGLIEAHLEGNIDVAEDLQLYGQTEITMPSIRRAARWFGVPIPTATGLNAASFKGQFAWARRSLSIDNAKFTVDGNEANGALTLHLGGERPLIDGTLAFTALDLTPYLEAARTQSFVFERLTSSWSEYDLVFPIIKYVDADLRLSAPKIAAAGYGFGRGAAAITIRGGKLIADIAELALPTGQVSAQVSADSNEMAPRYAVRGKIENFDAGSATAALFGSTVLSGRSTLLLDVSAYGQTPAEVMRRLSGKATLIMPEGGRFALDLKALRGGGKADQLPGWGASAKGQTSLERLEAKVHIYDGVLVADALRAHVGSLGVGVTGHADLADGRLDMNVIFKAGVQTERTLTQADLAGGETINVRGAWREPVIRALVADTADAPK